MPRADLQQRRLDLGADLLGQRAAGAEPAARRRVDRAGHVALEPDPLAAAADRGLLDVGHRREQRLGVGVVGVVVDASRGRAISTILPRYITATSGQKCRTIARSWAMNRNAMSNSRCRSWSRLTTCAWIDTSSAETGSSATSSLGLQGQRPGDADALALAAGELVGVAVVVLGVEPDDLEQLLDPRQDLLLRAPCCGPPAARRRSCRPCAAGSARCRGPGRSSGSRGAAASSRAGRCWRCPVPSNLHRAAGGLVEPGDQPPGRGLAAAGLARPGRASRPRAPGRRRRRRPARGRSVRRMSPEDFTGKYILRFSTSSTGLASGSSSVARGSELGQLAERGDAAPGLVVGGDVGGIRAPSGRVRWSRCPRRRWTRFTSVIESSSSTRSGAISGQHLGLVDRRRGWPGGSA